MKAKRFGCEEVIEADDLAALADAVAAHGRVAHAWDYPVAAVRNFACNYAEAVERLSDRVERDTEIGEVVVHPVSGDRVEDWLHFFDFDGFAENPGSASCYCLKPHMPTTAENPERPWRESRGIMAERLRKEVTFGYLA